MHADDLFQHEMISPSKERDGAAVGDILRLELFVGHEGAEIAVLANRDKALDGEERLGVGGGPDAERFAFVLSEELRCGAAVRVDERKDEEPAVLHDVLIFLCGGFRDRLRVSARGTDVGGVTAKDVIVLRDDEQRDVRHGRELLVERRRKERVDFAVEDDGRGDFPGP